MKKVWIETTEFFSQEQRQVSPQGSIHLSHGQTWDLCCIVHALPLKTPTILATFLYFWPFLCLLVILGFQSIHFLRYVVTMRFAAAAGVWPVVESTSFRDRGVRASLTRIFASLSSIRIFAWVSSTRIFASLSLTKIFASLSSIRIFA